MYWSMSRLLRFAAPLLVVLAIVGYLAGHRHTSSPPANAASKTRIAYGTSVLLEYPVSWRPTATTTAPAIPGLSISGAMLLAPGGAGAQAGLLSGQVPGNGTGPLPSGLLTQLRGAPQTEVVDLLNAQAYRYSRLSIKGYALQLYLYVIPSPGGKDAALACYASKALVAYLRQCERIVAGLTLVGRSPGDLTPEAGYASRLKGLIGTLDSERLTLRNTMRAQVDGSAISRLAQALADRFATTASSLATLEAPLPAGAAQAALASAILQARGDYETLAHAALGEGSIGYTTAQTRVAAAEADVDTALEAFTLLGYNPAG
jgi:hypothetical protein